MTRLIGVAGIAVLLAIAYLCSTNRKAVQWRIVAWGLTLQLIIGLLVLKVELGQRALSLVATAVKGLIAFSEKGGDFLFGELVTRPDLFIFAFKVLPIVIFLSSLFTCLYYLGIMQIIVGAMAKLMKRVMGVSGAESLAVAANVFMGQTEAPIIIAPYISSMTRSELAALMVGGMATVSGAILGGYIGLGISAEYLITASVMAAPASLMMAKILVPETGVPLTRGKIAIQIENTDANIIEAAARGAAQGMKLALNIAAMLLAFISIIYLMNGVLSWVGAGLGIEAWLGEPLTLQAVLGYLLAPLAFIMGVPAAEVTQVGRLIGLKVILNELVAYTELASLQQDMQVKSQLIATFALCGFANLGSLGIQIGGIGGLAPDRKTDLAKLGMRAVLGGSLASFTTATLAGMLM